MTTLRRRFAAVTALAAAAVGTLALTSSPALAHNELLSSDPVDGASLSTAPEAVSLTFAERADAKFVKIAVTGAGGTSVTRGAAQVAGTRVSQPLGALDAGKYTVAYRVVSVDGHPVSGTVTFTLTQAAGASPTVEATPTPSAATSAPGPTPSAAADGQRQSAEQDGPSVGLFALIGLAIAAAVALGVVAVRRRAGTRPGPG